MVVYNGKVQTKSDGIIISTTQKLNEMAAKKEETASFVLRLSQKIFDNEAGEPHIEWRGNIRHVQSGDETRFSNFEDAQDFVQKKLTDMTMKAVEDKSESDQRGILTKSFDFWKKMATATPKLVLDSIKDPKKQAAHLQEQIQEQFHQISDLVGQKIEDTIGSNPSKSEITDKLESLNKKVDAMQKKLDTISNALKNKK